MWRVITFRWRSRSNTLIVDKRFLITLFVLYALFSPRLGSAKEAGSVERGEALFRELGCVACHKVKEGGGTIGPDLTGIYGRVKTLVTGEQIQVDDPYLVESIRDPDAKLVKGFAPGLMPKIYTGLPEEDVGAIVAYLKSVPGEEKASPAATFIHQGPPAVWIWFIIGVLSTAFVSRGIYLMSRSISLGWIAVIVLVSFAGLAGGFLWTEYAPGSSHREFKIMARQFGYDPPIIRVNRGDRVSIEASSQDVVHGLYIDGYQIDEELRPGKSARFTFVANKEGKFGLRCSRTCGVLHPFMIGTLIVEPNYLFPGSIGLAIGLALGTFIYVAKRREEE